MGYSTFTIKLYAGDCSKSILSNVSRDLNFPIMTLILDEMTGEAGFMTRLEAFVDLLQRRREELLIG